jgi:hypothetical protein
MGLARLGGTTIGEVSPVSSSNLHAILFCEPKYHEIIEISGLTYPLGRFLPVNYLGSPPLVVWCTEALWHTPRR